MVLCFVGKKRRSLLLQSVWLLTRNRLLARPLRGLTNGDRTARVDDDQGVPCEVRRQVAGHVAQREEATERIAKAETLKSQALRKSDMEFVDVYIPRRVRW